ncbi:MAG: hypothetical protein Tsb0017_11540 [Geothermobacteraceae bacterium]
MALKALWRRMTPGDRWVFVGLALSALVLLALGLLLPAGRKVLVERDGKIVWQAPLDRDTVAEIDGPLGPTRVVIEQGQVRVTDSPCPLKVCVGMGAVHRAGDWLACVPNHLLVRVTGGGETERDYDLISR